jgi:exosortase E/protease (VPEID-CTERM system)
MTADALRLWQVWSPLARWRAVVILGLLVQLALLREVSEGRFLLLSRGGEAVRELWYLHTFTKVTIFASLALLVGALVEQRFRQTSLLTPRWMWRVSVLHIGAMGALLFLLPTLPIGFQDTMLREVELWRYAAASSVFFAWQWTAVLLIAPSMLIRGMRVSTSAFLLCAIAAAIILASADGVIISVMRALVEDSTLSLAMVFYTLIGDAEPVLSLRDGTPLLSAPGFAILIGAPCAGYQGMLASATIMAGLIILEWPRLHHGRALVLGVAAVAGVFVLNALRIALLFHIGVSHSPEMALDGFHSYFGTLSLLVVVGIALLTMQHRSFRQVKSDPKHSAHMSGAGHDRYWHVEHGKLILPLAIYLGVGMVLGLFNAGFDWTYPLLAIAGLTLMGFWRERIRHEFLNSNRMAPLAMGVGVYLLWIVMVPSQPEVDAAFALELNAVPLSVMIGWVIFRLIGFSIVVPVLEELAFRGGLTHFFRGILSQVTGQRSAALIALTLSSLAFGMMHVDVLAGTLAGVGFGLLVLQSGRVGNAIIAHAVTNLLLAITAFVTGQWSLF